MRALWALTIANIRSYTRDRAALFWTLAFPLIFIFMFASFPVGLVIYWTWNNLLTIAQQWVIMKRHGAFEESK